MSGNVEDNMNEIIRGESLFPRRRKLVIYAKISSNEQKRGDLDFDVYSLIY